MAIAVRWVVSVLSALVAVACTAAALLSSWVTTYVANTANVTETLAPIASSQALKEAIVTQAGNAAGEYVLENPVTSQVGEWTAGIDSFLQDVPLLSGLSGLLGVQDEGNVSAALEEATTLLAGQVQETVEAETQKFLDSPSFPQLFNQVLGSVHSQILGALSNPNPLPGDTLAVTLNLNPVIEAVRSNLDGTLGMVAGFIPEIQEEIPIFELQGVSSLQSWYRALVGQAEQYVIVAAVAAAFALLISPRRWVLAAGAAGLMAAVSTYFVVQIPSFAADATVELDPAFTSVLSQSWSLLSAPLYRSFQVALAASAVAAGLCLIIALVLTLVRTPKTPSGA